MGCGVHRGDFRHRLIRVGECARLIHVDFEPIQVGNGVHSRRIDIGRRSFPAQHPGGERISSGRRGSFRGRAYTPSPTSDKGCHHETKYDHLDRSYSSGQLRPSLMAEGPQ